MYRPFLGSQALLAVAAVACLFVATPSMAQVQTSALVLETEALDLETGMEEELSSAGLSSEAWRAITRYIEQDRYGVEWTVESGSDQLVHEDAKLLASDGAFGDQFGFSVAVSGDTVVVGAFRHDDQGSHSGSAYVFKKPGGGWSGTLSEAAKLLPSNGFSLQSFGTSVAACGDTVVVGAPYDDDRGESSGSAYVFERPAGGWSGTLSQNAKLLASDGALGDNFGQSVAVSGDTAVVGAFLNDDQGVDSGSAYVFEKPAGGWSGTLSQAAKLLASDGAGQDLLGWSVAVSGDTVVVGAYGRRRPGIELRLGVRLRKARRRLVRDAEARPQSSSLATDGEFRPSRQVDRHLRRHGGGRSCLRRRPGLEFRLGLRLRKARRRLVRDAERRRQAPRQRRRET